MINIKYFKSDSGVENGFDLSFYLKEYIPQEYYIKYDEDYVEEPFIRDILFENGLYDMAKEHFKLYLTDWFYECKYKEIPFIMYCDDYGIPSFFVDEKYSFYVHEIAEHIKYLIEKQKK